MIMLIMGGRGRTGRMGGRGRVGGTGTRGRIGVTSRTRKMSVIGPMLLACAMLFLPALPAGPALPAIPFLPACSACPALPALGAVLHAQHAAFRVKGRIVNERGDAIENADVRLEAFYGYAAGTFAGVRKFSAQTNRKGEWNVGGLQPGIWLFEAIAPGYVPETVVLPIRILTTVSMGTSGMALTWDLILKPVTAPDDVQGELLKEAAVALEAGQAVAIMPQASTP